MALFGSNDSIDIVIRLKDEFTSQLSKVEGSLASFKNSFESAADASKRFAIGLGAVATAFGAVAAAGVKTAAQLETSRQGFITLLGSAEKVDKLFAQIKKDAATTPFELPGLIQANQLLTQVTKDGSRSEDLLLNVGKALAAAGKGQPELDRIILNLQQIGNTAKISEMDVRQFGFAGINILELLADYYGVSKDAAGDMVKNSKDAFADLEGAFAKAGGAGGKFANAFKDQAGTFNQLLSNLKDQLNIFLSDFVKQTGIFDLLKDAMSRLVDFLNTNGPKIIQFFKDSVEWIKQHEWVIKVLGAMILGALIPAIAAMGIAFANMALVLAPFVAAGGALMLLIEGIREGNPLMIGIATAIGVMLVPAVMALGTAIMTTVVPALVAMAVAAAPWILGGLIIGGIVAGIIWVAKNWEKVWGGIQTGFKATVNFLIWLAEAWCNSWVDAVNIVIKALNSIQVSIPDWVPEIGGKSFGINIPLIERFTLPRLEHGGIVPGAIGTAVPILAHGQEQIIPAGNVKNGGGGDIYLTLNYPQFRSREDSEIILSEIEKALRDVSRGHKLQTI